MEHMLKIWLVDQAQRRLSGSQAIISAKVESCKVLYEEKKKAAVQLKLDQYFIK
jgi:hypothetical protein